MSSYAIKMLFAVVGAVIGSALAGTFALAGWLAGAGGWPLYILAVIGLAVFGMSAWWAANLLHAETERAVSDYYHDQADRRIADAERTLARPQRPALPGDVDKMLAEFGGLLEQAMQIFQAMVEKNGALRSATGSLGEYVDGINGERAKLREEVTRARRAIAVWNGEVIEQPRVAAPRRQRGPEEYAPAFLRRGTATNGAAPAGEIEADIASIIPRAPAEPPVTEPTEE